MRYFWYVYTQNLPQDVSHKQESRKLSNNVVSQYLSASEDISHCISNEYYQALSQDEPQNLSFVKPECMVYQRKSPYSKTNPTVFPKLILKNHPFTHLNLLLMTT